MQIMSEANLALNLERVKQITQTAAQQVDELVFTYGHLSEDAPERKVLESKVRDVLSDWSDQIWDCGGLPQELWTVVFQTNNGPLRWQYPCSKFIERTI